MTDLGFNQVERNHPDLVKRFPEPRIPPGKQAGGWVRWTVVCASAYMLGLNKNFEMGENLDIKGMLEKGIIAGRCQHWKLGTSQSAPSYFRILF